MKKIIVIIAILILPVAGFAQSTDTTIATITTEIIAEKVEEVKPKKASSVIKAKLIRLNHRKSNDIISVKAYRKSLHVKMRTKKLC
ncbi:hypothetical protein [Winogradskyella immobilis]|uniref:Uncharacterized protein n=1 Tax=Winogradskyella immobilis TaxID=2816852 RepID=A0ABS8EIV1_9FLAO|nr:hypothetical protein [Winogradskyella immobilis]MCC1482972.1 hypothetical protein [Winogradskyella immobilis]MCG0015067.1 hypothetical protein [Winogradskyella immobilis]